MLYTGTISALFSYFTCNNILFLRNQRMCLGTFLAFAIFVQICITLSSNVDMVPKSLPRPKRQINVVRKYHFVVEYIGNLWLFIEKIIIKRWNHIHNHVSSF